MYPDKEVARPKKYSNDEDFISAVELKAIAILGKFLKKEKDLMDKFLGKEYKCLNRISEIAQIKYGERPPPAYTRAAKPSIENVTKKKRAAGQLAKKLPRRRRLLLLLVLKRVERVMKILVKKLLANKLMTR